MMIGWPIVLGGAAVDVVVLEVVVVVGVVVDVVVGVVVVGVGVAEVVVGSGVTVVVRGAGCWGRGCATGTSRGAGVTTTVAVSAAGITAGCVDVTGAVDTAMLLAELTGVGSAANCVMPKTASAATAAAADTPKAISGPRRRGGMSSQS
jgi:hypothetical protein